MHEQKTPNSDAHTNKAKQLSWQKMSAGSQKDILPHRESLGQRPSANRATKVAERDKYVAK
jgi:hypothetical protein